MPLYLNQEGGASAFERFGTLSKTGAGYRRGQTLGFKADQRDYGIGAQILRDLGVRTMRLLTNNPRKFIGLDGYISPLWSRSDRITPVSELNRRYLKTKKDKLGHQLSSV